MKASCLAALLLGLCAVSCHARKLQEDTSLTLVDAFCTAQGDGNFPDFLVNTPLCAPSYIACAGGKGAVLADLDIIATPNGAWVPAVFQNLSTVANVSERAVPGAIGTIGCNCTALYEDPESAVACAVCGLIQEAGFCTPDAADDLSSFSCQAPYPGNASLFVNCGIGGPAAQTAAPGGETFDEALVAFINEAFGVTA